jgi:hypothetical protein
MELTLDLTLAQTLATIPQVEIGPCTHIEIGKQRLVNVRFAP